MLNKKDKMMKPKNITINEIICMGEKTNNNSESLKLFL